jgi:hypothetical protein
VRGHSRCAPRLYVLRKAQTSSEECRSRGSHGRLTHRTCRPFQAHRGVQSAVVKVKDLNDGVWPAHVRNRNRTDCVLPEAEKRQLWQLPPPNGREFDRTGQSLPAADQRHRRGGVRSNGRKRDRAGQALLDRAGQALLALAKHCSRWPSTASAIALAKHCSIALAKHCSRWPSTARAGQALQARSRWPSTARGWSMSNFTAAPS